MRARHCPLFQGLMLIMTFLHIWVFNLARKPLCRRVHNRSIYRVLGRIVRNGVLHERC